MSERRPPLILAHVVVGLGILALAGALFHRREAVVFGAMFGYLAAMVHGLSFALRVRGRREPAVMLGSARGILAATLIAVAGTALANFILVAVYVGTDKCGPIDATPALAWAIALLVLCWRVWIRPSARRAGVMQIIAVAFAVPGILITVSQAAARGAIHRVPMLASDVRLVLDTSMFVTFIVVAAAGPVLDNLFASIDDQPSHAPPVAVLRA